MEAIRNYLSFFLTLLCVIGLFALAFFKNADIVSTIPMVLGVYIGGRTVQKGAEITAASRDENCNTMEALRTINGITTPASVYQAPRQQPTGSNVKPDSPD